MKLDKRRHERRDIADRLKNQFPNLEVQIGGQTGLDLAAEGRNKSQILRDFQWYHELFFFGDMMEEGQNDYPLGKVIMEKGGHVYNVEDYKETWKLLSK